MPKSLEHHWLLSHFLVVGARRSKTDRDQRRTSLRNLFTLPIATSSLSKKANLDLPHSRQTLQNAVLILSLNSFDEGEARFFVSRFIDRLINFTNFPFIMKIGLISVVSKKNGGTLQCNAMF